MNEDVSGFVAGTLIHTDKGLVPIQDIKVDDLILSKPVLSKFESGRGDIEYQPVISTFKSPKILLITLNATTSTSNNV